MLWSSLSKVGSGLTHMPRWLHLTFSPTTVYGGDVPGLTWLQLSNICIAFYIPWKWEKKSKLQHEEPLINLYYGFQLTQLVSTFGFINSPNWQLKVEGYEYLSVYILLLLSLAGIAAKKHGKLLNNRMWYKSLIIYHSLSFWRRFKIWYFAPIGTSSSVAVFTLGEPRDIEWDLPASTRMSSKITWPNVRAQTLTGA